MKQLVPLKIWLKNREQPIEILASTDCVMGFTDFVNGNYPSNLYHMEFINRNKKRWLVIQQSQVQAFEFVDFVLGGNEK